MPTHLTVKGLILRETAFGEADKLFDLFTERGMLTVRARGVRKAGSKYAAVTQVFSYGEYCLRESGGRYYLDSAAAIELFYDLRTDLAALALAAYFSEVSRKIATDQQQPQILRLLLHCLHHLSVHDRPQPLIKAVFELRLMRELGYAPNLLCCAACGEFLPARPVFRIPERDFLCAECYAEMPEAPVLPEQPAPPRPHYGTAGVLKAARHIVYADENRFFQFRLADSACAVLEQYTGAYLRSCLETDFRTLRFYRDIAGECDADSAPQPGHADMTEQ